ncbi:MAG: sulfatase-like hydrolase/transferase [Burkholderiaceae bacterium]
MIKRILFIMMDQLRWDYLSCYGHPSLQTPNLDALAARGVRFSRAYTQGTSCGNSRASIYTGRYPRSHGATWNDIPFELNQWTLADYLAPLGVQTTLLGKTHMRADLNGLQRLGIDPESELGRHLAATGFENGERDDGLHPSGPDGRYNPVEPRYNHYLREKGFGGGNPWLDWANSAEGENGEVLNGFFMRHANRPARIPAEFSESAYMTDRAIDFIEQAGDSRWCLHLSYIKPHWPYIAPAPYHNRYGPEDVLAARRSPGQDQDDHPVYRAFAQMRWGQVWRREGARETVIPAYMGLVRQLDDEIGRLIGHLRAKGMLDETLIAITADHGDYLGDHWLGEKDLFHDQSSKVPLIIVDPRPGADGTRGAVEDRLVGTIDLLPTFIEAFGGQPPAHRLEGASLMPLLEAQSTPGWRETIFSECDYVRMPVRRLLERGFGDARLTMAFDGRYKFVHCLGFPPMLFDLQEDPDEFRDLGRDPGRRAVIDEMKDRMLDWSAGLRNRTAMTDETMAATIGRSYRRGILIGAWDEADAPG